jgi:hypothetical protein
MARQKYWIQGTLGLTLICTGLLLWAGTPGGVQAQCGDIPPNSSCITCHEKEDPVYEQGEWHALHARKDCCAQCHGGNCSATDQVLAHQGMTDNPLEDIYTNCYHCHPDDYQARAGRFGLALGITPGSRPTPTQPAFAAAIAHPLLVSPQPVQAGGPAWSGVGAFLGMLSLALLALGIELRYILSHSH